jgi:hypothetical protein
MLTTRPSTANTTPDPGQGGDAVTGNTNTGHAATTCDAAAGGGSQTKTCIWSGFAAVIGLILGVTLKVDWAENGTLGGGENQFLVEYSLNNGSSWSTLFNHTIIEAADSGTASAVLSLTQDLTQVKVRDKLFAQTGDAVVVGTVSDIRIDVVTQDPQPIFIS